MIFVIWYMDFTAELEIYRWLVCFFSAHAKILKYLHNYIFFNPLFSISGFLPNVKKKKKKVPSVFYLLLSINLVM